MVRIYLIFCVISLVFGFGFTQSDIEVQCVPLRDCPNLLKLLKPPISKQTILFLQTAQCGVGRNNHPKVACAQPVSSTCQTPDGQLGKCTPARECKSFVELLKSQSQRPNIDIAMYLQKLQCRSDGTSSVKVCCPNDQKQPPTWTALPLLLDDHPDITEERPTFLPNPENGQCGSQESNKIVGGKITEMDEFPWTALLEYRTKRGVQTPCAGTLISNKYVVTAAHCTDTQATGKTRKLINVILGEFDKDTPRDCINYLGVEDCADPPLRVPIEEVIIHEQWYQRANGEINHDIALIRLVDYVSFTNFIRPICLPSANLVLVDRQKFMVTGWGQTETGKASSIKLKTTISMANQDACIQKYKREKHLDVGSGEICVGGEKGNDTCFGDSGGPLMFPKNIKGGGIWFLAGIVSFGPNQCGIKDYPALYTYVPKYIDWIYRTVKP